jgi:glycosyltransferase involved in cell wall biosynthesis
MDRQDDPATFLWFGNLVDQKRPDLFVRAISRAAETVPVRGIMAGGGSRHDEIERLIGDLRAPVEMEGHVNDVQSALDRARSVVLFSWFEGVSFAVEEAMWVGRPVLCSPLQSLRWLLDDTGVFADDVETAVARIIEPADLDYAAGLAERASARIRRLIAPDAPWPRLDMAYRQDLGSS